MGQNSACAVVLQRVPESAAVRAQGQHRGAWPTSGLRKVPVPSRAGGSPGPTEDLELMGPLSEMHGRARDADTPRALSA